MVEMLEVVSSHFGYTEEYVLDRTLPWLKRKYQQASREKYEQRQIISEETMRGVLAAVTNLFGGKNVEKILLPAYEEDTNENTQKADEWVTTQWWKPKPAS